MRNSFNNKFNDQHFFFFFNNNRKSEYKLNADHILDCSICRFYQTK